jgi:hypothetical protein
MIISDCTVSYRPFLSSDRALYRKNNKTIDSKERIRVKSGHGSQRGLRYQDELVGCKIKSTQEIIQKVYFYFRQSSLESDTGLIDSI